MGGYEKEFRKAAANNESVVVITEATLSPLVNSNLQLMKEGGEKYGYKLANVALNPHYCGFDIGTQIVATFQREQIAQQPQQSMPQQSIRRPEQTFEEQIKSYRNFPIVGDGFERFRGIHFYLSHCPICDDPMIIYKRAHAEPSDSEIERILKWVKKHLPHCVPDFERLHPYDHFYFELRTDFGDSKVDIKGRKTLLKCHECGQYFKFSEMDKTEYGLLYCHSCFAKTKGGQLLTLPRHEEAFEERIKKLRQQGLIP
jgi:ribosomal protein L37AE/L43A